MYMASKDTLPLSHRLKLDEETLTSRFLSEGKCRKTAALHTKNQFRSPSPSMEDNGEADQAHDMAELNLICKHARS